MTIENLVLPFKYPKVEIGQGFHGDYTHTIIRPTLDQSYSVDFNLPVGTEVYAAKGGTVRFVAQNMAEYYEGLNFEEGKLCLANLIEVMHDDGTFTCYQHFGSNQILVNGGMNIKEGDILGYTGKSGWIGPVPHLHFSLYTRTVQKNPFRIMTQSIPFTFQNYDGPLEDKEIKKLKGNYCGFSRI